MTSISHNTSYLCRPQHLFTSAKHLFTSATTSLYIGQCCDLHQPQHLSFTSATTSIYVGQYIYLHRPKHLFTLASAVTCIGHNTFYLCRPQHLFTSAKTLVYIGQCCDLHWPQHLSFASTKILTCTGQNTGHNTSMCQEKYMPASATTQACVSKNTGLCKQK